MYTVKFYQTNRGEYPVKEFIDQLDKKIQAKIYSHLDLLQQDGPELPRPYSAHVRGKIKELRIRISPVNVRILYFFYHEKNIILLHALKKKTKKLQERDILIAHNNMKKYISAKKED